MSTPRKRWFKVADSVLREDWDDWTLATVTRLMAWLNQRRARDGVDDQYAGEALIGEHDAMVITRIKRPHVALQRLARLPLDAGLTSASASLEQVHSGSAVRLNWSKFANFQRSNTRESDKKLPTPGSSDLRSPISGTEEKKEEKKETSADADAPPNEPTATASPAEDPAPPDVAPDPASKEKPAKLAPPEAMQFAEDYRSALVAKRPGFKQPTPAAFARWVDQARLMLQERPLEEARALARWLFEGECKEARFWLPNVLSVPKFRDKYETMAAQKARSEGSHEENQRGNGGSGRPRTIRDAAEKLLRDYGQASGGSA